MKSKPINLSINGKHNEIDYGVVKDRVKIEMIGEGLTSTKSPAFDRSQPRAIDDNGKNNENNEQEMDFSENDSLEPQGWLSRFLGSLIQRVQVSSKSLLQDKLGELTPTLNNLGITAIKSETAKQLDTASGLVHLLSPYDPDFYTSRLEQAGFFGGNGWFANKGGILGGPGALLSTGSLLTDYTIAYRK